MQGRVTASRDETYRSVRVSDEWITPDPSRAFGMVRPPVRSARPTARRTTPRRIAETEPEGATTFHYSKLSTSRSSGPVAPFGIRAPDVAPYRRNRIGGCNDISLFEITGPTPRAGNRL
ncbi:hypothetical protein JCM17092_30110 [Haloplanus litoreus]